MDINDEDLNSLLDDAGALTAEDFTETPAQASEGGPREDTPDERAPEGQDGPAEPAADTEEVTQEESAREPEKAISSDGKTMPPQAQQLTYIMAQQMHAAETARLIRDGWSLGEKLDEAKKESPVLRPFDKMSYQQKSSYLDGSANAVMALLGADFILEPSANPEMAIPSGQRKEAEKTLAGLGWTAADVNAAIDAIEAAGYVVKKGPTKGVKMMDAYFTMATEGQPVSPEEAEPIILSTLNMARKEGLPLSDMNVFLRAKNAEYGYRPPMPMLTPQSEADRIAESLKAEYEASWTETLQRTPTSPVSVPGLQRTVLSDNDFLAVWGDAVRDARMKVVARTSAVRDPEIRKLVFASLSAFEHGDFFDRHQKEETAVGGRWKEALDAVMEATAAIDAKRSQYDTDLRRWRAFKWYEKVFIPRPTAPTAAIAELEERRLTIVEKMRQAYAEDHNVLMQPDPAGTFTITPTLSLSKQGRPVLTLERKLADGTKETSTLLFMKDGTVRDVTDTAAGTKPEPRRITQAEAVLRQREEQLIEELKAAATLARQYRISEERRRELLPKNDMNEVYRLLEKRRLEKEAVGKTALAIAELRRRQRQEQQETMPSLHPNLAGNISQKDVDILKAYRLNGGRGKDLQGVIDSLKEKQQIVVDGTMTYRRTHSYDPATVPTNRVMIGLRLGADGHISVFNPVNGAEIGPVRQVFGTKKNLDFSDAFVRAEEQQEKKQEKQERQPRRSV